MAVWRWHCVAGIGVITPIPYHQNMPFSVDRGAPRSVHASEPCFVSEAPPASKFRFCTKRGCWYSHFSEKWGAGHVNLFKKKRTAHTKKIRCRCFTSICKRPLHLQTVCGMLGAESGHESCQCARMNSQELWPAGVPERAAAPAQELRPAALQPRAHSLQLCGVRVPLTLELRTGESVKAPEE